MPIDYQTFANAVTNRSHIYIIVSRMGIPYYDLTDDGVQAILRALDLREAEVETHLTETQSGEIIATAHVRLYIMGPDGVMRKYESAASSSSMQFEEPEGGEAKHTTSGGKLRRYTLVQMAVTRARKDAVILAAGITRDWIEQRAKELGLRR